MKTRGPGAGIPQARFEQAKSRIHDTAQKKLEKAQSEGIRPDQDQAFKDAQGTARKLGAELATIDPMRQAQVSMKEYELFDLAKSDPALADELKMNGQSVHLLLNAEAAGISTKELTNYMEQFGTMALMQGDFQTFQHFAASLAGLESADRMVPKYNRAVRQTPAYQRPKGAEAIKEKTIGGLAGLRNAMTNGLNSLRERFGNPDQSIGEKLTGAVKDGVSDLQAGASRVKERFSDPDATLGEKLEGVWGDGVEHVKAQFAAPGASSAKATVEEDAPRPTAGKSQSTQTHWEDGGLSSASAQETKKATTGSASSTSMRDIVIGGSRREIPASKLGRRKVGDLNLKFEKGARLQQRQVEINSKDGRSLTLQLGEGTNFDVSNFGGARIEQKGRALYIDGKQIGFVPKKKAPAKKKATEPAEPEAPLAAKAKPDAKAKRTAAPKSSPNGRSVPESVIALDDIGSLSSRHRIEYGDLSWAKEGLDELRDAGGDKMTMYLLNRTAGNESDMLRAAMDHASGVQRDVGLAEILTSKDAKAYAASAGVYAGKADDAEVARSLKNVKASLNGVIRAEFDVAKNPPEVRLSMVDLEEASGRD